MTSSPGRTIDGVAVPDDDDFYVFNGAGNALSASADTPAARSTVRVDQGNTQAKSTWALVDTTGYYWARQDAHVNVMDFGAMLSAAVQ
jgi:hypothetical protein